MGDWKPESRNCHTNALTLAARDPRYKAVHGWLCADYIAVGQFTFYAHSVVEDPTGELFDITPNPLWWSYPFLRDEQSDDHYSRMITDNNLIQLVHFLGSASRL